MFGLFSNKKKVVTRIAPSPTGEMHVGTVRTALFNYLFAKQHGGTYFVRVEDTDKERNKEEWVDAIWRDFEWCGLTPDKKFRTSEHLDRHRELLHLLVKSGKAYISKEPKKDDPAQTVEVVRLRNSGTSVTFTDLIRGDVTFDTTELGDFVIARSVDDPLYHFAVVVDDGDAGVTHVLRAEEHISNTPRQILILEALGFERPQYGHFPLILAPDHSKLSKRRHGASIDKYRARGFLAPAVLNYLALLGWHPTDDREIFSLEELVKEFDLSRVQKGGAIFSEEKLLWFNREYLHRLSDGEFDALLMPYLGKMTVDLSRYRKLLRERSSTLRDAADLLTKGEFDYLERAPTLDAEKLVWKKDSPEIAEKHLTHALKLMKTLPIKPSPEEVKSILMPYADEVGRGSVLWPIRFALSGKEKSPDPFELISLLGREEALERLRSAEALLLK